MEQDVAKTLAANLRKWVTAKGYRTVEQFAYENGLHKGMLGLILKADRLPRLDTLVRIATALEITLDDLYPLGADKKKPIQATQIVVDRKALENVVQMAEELRNSTRKLPKIKSGPAR